MQQVTASSLIKRKMSTTTTESSVIVTPFSSKSVVFNGRCQMKCLDKEFIFPFVEKLIFPEGRQIVYDLSQVIEEHREQLLTSIEKKTRHHYLSSNSASICTLDEFDICKNKVSLKGMFYDHSYIIGFQRKYIQCMLTYTAVESELLLSHLHAEEDGFDVIIRACYSKPYIDLEIRPVGTCADLVLRSTLGTYLINHKSDYYVIILIVEHMTDHLAVLRQIKENMQKNVDKWRYQSFRIVLIVGDHNKDFTTKELTKYFSSQKITMVMSENFM